MTAKTLSLVSKIVAIVFAMVAFFVFDKVASEIIPIATFVAGSFLPIDISKIISNIKKPS